MTTKTYNQNLNREVALKEIFPLEDHDFTPWLAEHLDLVSDATGLSSLELVEVESKQNQYADQRRIDIIAFDEETNVVVIENQYGSADHSHWGKTALFYLPPLEVNDQKVIHIWVAEDFDMATIKAIENLNQKHNYNIYLLEAKCICSDNDFKLDLNLVLSPEMVADEAPVDTQAAKVQKQLTENQKLSSQMLNKLTEELKFGVKYGYKDKSACKVDVDIAGKRSNEFRIMFAPTQERITLQLCTDYTDKYTCKDNQPQDVALYKAMAEELGDAVDNLDKASAKSITVKYIIDDVDFTNLTSDKLAEIKTKYNKMLKVAKSAKYAK